MTRTRHREDTGKTGGIGLKKGDRAFIDARILWLEGLGIRPSPPPGNPPPNPFDGRPPLEGTVVVVSV